MSFLSKQKNAARRRPVTTDRRAEFYTQGDRSRGSKDKKPKRGLDRSWIYNIPALLATLVIILSLLYSLFLNTKPKVIIVNDQDTAVQPFLRSNDSYQSIAQEELMRSILNRSKLTLNTESVASNIHDRVPEATEVSITLPIIGRNPVVYLSIAEPSFVLASKLETFVIDEKGRAVVTSKELPDPEFAKTLLVVNDDSGIEVQVGHQAIPKDQVVFIESIQYLLKQKGIVVKKMVLPALVNEVHVYPENKKYFIKYNFLLDVSEQTGKYLAVSNRLSKERFNPTKYVDVRVEERVYVK